MKMASCRSAAVTLTAASQWQTPTYSPEASFLNLISWISGLLIGPAIRIEALGNTERERLPVQPSSRSRGPRGSTLDVRIWRLQTSDSDVQSRYPYLQPASILIDVCRYNILYHLFNLFSLCSWCSPCTNKMFIPCHLQTDGVCCFLTYKNGCPRSKKWKIMF